MYNNHMLEWRGVCQNTVHYFMQIDVDGMIKCLKDTKEYVAKTIAKNKGLQLSYGDRN